MVPEEFFGREARREGRNSEPERHCVPFRTRGDYPASDAAPELLRFSWGGSNPPQRRGRVTVRARSELRGEPHANNASVDNSHLLPGRADLSGPGGAEAGRENRARHEAGPPPDLHVAC